MAQDNKKELSPDELLKKLLTSFGGEEEQSNEDDQLTIEDASKDTQEQARPKVFRVKKEDKRKADVPQKEAPSDDGEEKERKELEERIKRAELFVAGMKDRKNGEEAGLSEKKEESAFSDAFEEAFAVENKAAEPKDEPEDETVTEEAVKESQEAEEQKELEELEEPEELEESEQIKEIKEPEAFDETEDFGRSEDFAQEESLDDSALKQEDFKLFDEQEEPEETEQVTEDAQAVSDTEERAQVGGASEVDEAELDMMMLFGEKKKLEEMVGKEEARRRRLMMEGDAGAESIKEEYVSKDQNTRFFKMLRGAYAKINFRVVIACLALIAVFFLELVLPELVASGVSLERICGSFLAENVFANPVMTALCGLQVTALLVGVAYKEVYEGFKAFATGRSVPQMFLSLTVLFTVIYEVALIFCHSAKAPFYNVPVASMALVAVLITQMNLSRTILTFKIVSSKRSKYVITHKGKDHADLEKEAFGQYMSEKAGVFGVGKTDFVKNFAKRSAREPRYKGIVVILSSVAAVVGVVFFVLGYYFAKEDAFLSGLVMAIQSVLFSIPASAFIVYALPFYKASKKAFHLDSAIVGEFSLEEYADATVISFDDKEVFPARNVKVHSLKLFGDTRIDHVLFGAASVFHRIGGPLEEVFDVATRESG